jgi:hypothetical protein
MTPNQIHLLKVLAWAVLALILTVLALAVD